jgi:hypothetical protein
MEVIGKKVIGSAFNFGSLQLWRTEGLHTEWECIRTVKLPLAYENKKLPRSRVPSAASTTSSEGHKVRAVFRTQSTVFSESHNRTFQKDTMTRADIMQWATARKVSEPQPFVFVLVLEPEI